MILYSKCRCIVTCGDIKDFEKPKSGGDSYKTPRPPKEDEFIKKEEIEV